MLIILQRSLRQPEKRQHHRAASSGPDRGKTKAAEYAEAHWGSLGTMRDSRTNSETYSIKTRCCRFSGFNAFVTVLSFKITGLMVLLQWNVVILQKLKKEGCT